MNVQNMRLETVRQKIRNSANRAGREPDSIRLLAVSKRHSIESIQNLIDAGQRDFGENQVQEALSKMNSLTDEGLIWHFIGPVQSNKTRDIAANFDWVQSVEREKILRRLSAQRPVSRGRLNICLQVNIDRESQKAGVAIEDLAPLASMAEEMPGLRFRGLMCIPAQTTDSEKTRRSFHRLRELMDELNAAGHNLDTLSMGMSADMELAIECGSNLVRVGTDLFGPRPS